MSDTTPNTCPNDTNGDGDCAHCANKGGCFYRRNPSMTHPSLMPDDPEHGERWADVRAKLAALEDAAYECGEWTGDDDRPCIAVLDELDAKRAALFEAIRLAVKGTVVARMEKLCAAVAQTITPHPADLFADAIMNGYVNIPPHYALLGIDWARGPDASVEVEVSPDGPAPYGRSHESRWMHVSGAYPVDETRCEDMVPCGRCGVARDQHSRGGLYHDIAAAGGVERCNGFI